MYIYIILYTHTYRDIHCKLVAKSPNQKCFDLTLSVKKQRPCRWLNEIIRMALHPITHSFPPPQLKGLWSSSHPPLIWAKMMHGERFGSQLENHRNHIKDMRVHDSPTHYCDTYACWIICIAFYVSLYCSNPIRVVASSVQLKTLPF